MSKKSILVINQPNCSMTLHVDRMPQAGICSWKSMVMGMPMLIWMIQSL